MKTETIDKLCCPFDKNDLELYTILQDVNKNIIQGLLTCKQCNRYYPIIHGIPIMNPDEFREFKLEQPLINSWQNLHGRQIINFRLDQSKHDDDEV